MNQQSINMKPIIYLFFISCFFMTCQQTEAPSQANAAERTTDTNTASTNSSNDKAEKSQAKITIPSFVIQNFKGDQETPKSNIFVTINGQNIPIKEAVIACEPIDKKDFSDFQIPAEAMEACGGWWAGTGDYFYITKDKDANYYSIMYAQVGEESADYNYESLMKMAYNAK